MTQQMFKPFNPANETKEHTEDAGAIPADAQCAYCYEGKVTEGTEEEIKESKLYRCCACRGEGLGIVHIKCVIAFARTSPHPKSWHQCPACKTDYYGPIQKGLAEVQMAESEGKGIESLHDILAEVNIAMSLNATGGANKAIPRLRSVYDTLTGMNYALMNPQQREKTVGPVMSVGTTFAQALVSVGQFDEGLDVMTYCQYIVETYCNESTKSNMNGICNQLLGTLYCYKGEFKKALPLVEEGVVAAREFGKQELIVAMSTLASLHGDLGNLEKMLAISTEAYKIAKQVFGEKHPTTQETALQLKRAKAEVSNPEKSAIFNALINREENGRAVWGVVTGLTPEEENDAKMNNGTRVKVGVYQTEDLPIEFAEFSNDKYMISTVINSISGTGATTTIFDNSDNTDNTNSDTAPTSAIADLYSTYRLGNLQHTQLLPHQVILDIGSEVKVVGLRSRSDLNGMAGIIKGFNKETGRYSTQLQNGQVFALKQANAIANINILD